VERVSGSVVVDSARGSHTTFTLTLPLTLAITKALLVEEAGQVFAIPLHFAERIIDPEAGEIVQSTGRERVLLDGQWTPVKRLGGLLGLHPRPTGPVVVLRVGATRALVRVERLVAHEEIVVKSLGALLTGHPLFAGVTARGSGAMALILDVPALVEAEGTVQRAAPKPVIAAVEAPAPQPANAPGAVRPHVMFVDDSLSVRKVAERALTSLGVDVTIAVDGLDALEKMRTGSFDLVFTDLEMPRMHGFELIRELRFLKAHKDLPIVVVTSRSGQKHQEQARSLGANEYITKPFTPQSLAAAVDTWARPRAAARSTGSSS
jgi:chemosensory pili system protein ChpA (sensor histidine kinase/response regulator)